MKQDNKAREQRGMDLYAKKTDCRWEENESEGTERYRRKGRAIIINSQQPSVSFSRLIRPQVQ